MEPLQLKIYQTLPNTRTRHTSLHTWMTRVYMVPISSRMAKFIPTQRTAWGVQQPRGRCLHGWLLTLRRSMWWITSSYSTEKMTTVSWYRRNISLHDNYVRSSGIRSHSWFWTPGRDQSWICICSPWCNYIPVLPICGLHLIFEYMYTNLSLGICNPSSLSNVISCCFVENNDHSFPKEGLS